MFWLLTLQCFSNITYNITNIILPYNNIIIINNKRFFNDTKIEKKIKMTIVIILELFVSNKHHEL